MRRKLEICRNCAAESESGYEMKSHNDNLRLFFWPLRPQDARNLKWLVDNGADINAPEWHHLRAWSWISS